MSFEVDYPKDPIKSGNIFEITVESNSTLELLEIKDTQGLISLKPKLYQFQAGVKPKFICKAYYPLTTQVTIKDPISKYEKIFDLVVGP